MERRNHTRIYCEDNMGYKKWLDDSWEFKTQFWKELYDFTEDDEVILSIAKILHLLHEDHLYEEGMDLIYLISSLLGLYDDELMRLYEKVKHYFPQINDVPYIADNLIQDFVYEGISYYE